MGLSWHLLSSQWMAGCAITASDDEESESMMIQQLTQLSTTQAEQIDTLLAESFPPGELTPIEELTAHVNSGLAVALVTVDDAQVINGLSLVYTMPTSGDLYLFYLAVSPDARGQGLGARLFAETQVFTQGQPDADYLYWEVHQPKTDDAQDLDNRRVRFYQRLGGLHLDYVTGPGFYEGEHFHPLWLMCVLKTAQQPLPEIERVCTWVRDIYELLYPHELDVRDEIIANLRKS